MNLKPTALERATDKFVSVFSPAMAHQRAIDRARFKAFSYDAARYSETRRHAGVNNRASESPSNIRDRNNLIWEARDVCDNHPIARSILLKLSSYVCSKVNYFPATGDPDIDHLYRKYFNQWAAICDITGRHTFADLMQLAIMSMFRDGDCGFIIVNGPQEPFIKLQSIEADRIGNPYDYSYNEDYLSGISIDSVGRPISYRIFYRSRIGYYGPPINEIPALSFVHLFDPTRFDAYRGITGFATFLETLRDKHEILNFEKIAVKWGSSKAGVIKKEYGEADPADFYSAQNDTSSPQAKLERIEAGTVSYLGPGEEMDIFHNERPSTTFNGFVETMVRDIALGCNLPYGFVYDLAKLGGPSARMDANQAKRAIERIQIILENKVLTKIKNFVLAKGISNGSIPMTDNWNEGRFMFPAWPTIDVGRESAANLAENRQGLKSAADILGEEGLYWRDVQEQLAIEAQNIMMLAKKYNVPVDMIQMLTPNGNPGQQPGESPLEKN